MSTGGPSQVVKSMQDTQFDAHISTITNQACSISQEYFPVVRADCLQTANSWESLTGVPSSGLPTYLSFPRPKDPAPVR
jgi:hypothetical protein